MRYLVLGVCFAATLATASAHPLLNDREATSYVLGTRAERELDNLGATKEAFEPVFKEVLEGLKGEACAFSVNNAWTAKIGQFPQFENDREMFIKGLRQSGLIDDMVLRLLLQAHYVQKDVNTKLNDELKMPEGEVPEDMRPMKEFSQKRARGKCLHETVRELLAAYRQGDKNFTPKMLRAKINVALKQKYITALAHEEIAEALYDDMPSWQVSLADYVQKRTFLRTQFPLPDATERSEFVTERAGKEKISYRQRLYLTYTPIQITLMGDVIKKLKERLESPRIEILVYDLSDEVRETLTLDPMERFRFAIRVLRKEMKLLSTNTYFAGRQPSYTDLMTSAYERGLITALELDEVAKLEEIWNPTKTFWEKASTWVRMFGGVLAVVIPPPYGFIPSLAIVGIEAAFKETPNDDQDSLF